MVKAQVAGLERSLIHIGNLYRRERSDLGLIRLEPRITPPSINSIVRYTVLLCHHRNTHTVSAAFCYKLAFEVIRAFGTATALPYANHQNPHIAPAKSPASRNNRSSDHGRIEGVPCMLTIDAVTPHTFADEQVKVRPEISNKSITDYHMGVSLMLKFCARKGYIRRNEFAGVSLKDYGKKTVSWLAYEPSEMLTIFDHDWSTQERLLLCIIATTGMRLSETGMLTWERFNDTEYDGIRYFTLLDTGEEIVSVKNTGSSRHIPIHPNLKLPPNGTGRLFDYTVDENGLCSSSAGDKINPELNKLVPHIRKSAHSFRRTLKKMLRDVGVSKEINDEITGHGSGDIAGDVYGGTSIQTRAEAISKLDLSWLKQ